MQPTTWNLLPYDILKNSPFDLPSLKAVSLVCKRWRVFALNRMLSLVCRDLPLERLGFVERTVDIILKEYGSSLHYLETKNQPLQRAIFCTNLKHLSLKNQNLPEAELLSLTSKFNSTTLTSLDLTRNKVNSKVIQALGTYFTALTELNLTKSNHTVLELAAMASSCRTLTKLILQENQRIGFNDLELLKPFSNTLTYLDVSNCYIMDAGAIAIATFMTALKTLNLKGNYISDFAVSQMITSPLTSLTELDIGYNPAVSFNGETMISTTLLALKSLSLESSNAMDHPILLMSQHLTDLTHLNLSRGNFSVESFQSLGMITTLESLLLFNFHGSKIINHLSTLTRLKFLDISSSFITSVDNVCRSFSYLEALDICSNNIGHPGVVEIANSFPRLRALTLGHHSIDDRDLLVIATKITTLTSLTITESSISKEAKSKVRKIFKEKCHHIVI